MTPAEHPATADKLEKLAAEMERDAKHPAAPSTVLRMVATKLRALAAELRLAPNADAGYEAALARLNGYISDSNGRLNIQIMSDTLRRLQEDKKEILAELRQPDAPLRDPNN